VSRVTNRHDPCHSSKAIADSIVLGSQNFQNIACIERSAVTLITFIDLRKAVDSLTIASRCACVRDRLRTLSVLCTALEAQLPLRHCPLESGLGLFDHVTRHGTNSVMLMCAPRHIFCLGADVKTHLKATEPRMNSPGF
jgi:hypothetical protein